VPIFQHHAKVCSKCSTWVFSCLSTACVFYFTLLPAYPACLKFTCNFLHFFLHFTSCLVFVSQMVSFLNKLCLGSKHISTPRLIALFLVVLASLLVLILQVVSFVYIYCFIRSSVVHIYIAPHVHLLHNVGKVCKILVRKPYAKRPLGRPRLRWGDILVT